MMKHYRAVAPHTVTVHDNGVETVLDPRFDLRNHSPTGFSWGYNGSGPAQLSLALLADAWGLDAVALDTYQPFKFAILSQLPADAPWCMFPQDIRAVSAALKSASPTLARQQALVLVTAARDYGRMFIDGKPVIRQDGPTGAQGGR